MAESNDSNECAICLESMIQPCKLPCNHVFCYLCIKGTFNNSAKCSLCRITIPPDYLEKPNLIKKENESANLPSNEFVWYYKGNNGYWQYDERTNQIIETQFMNKVSNFQTQIAGQLYNIDFVNMQQSRTDNPRLKRAIKRDLKDMPFKGVAGISALKLQ